MDFGQSLPFLNAGASWNCGRLAVDGEWEMRRRESKRRVEVRVAVLRSGGMVMTVAEEVVVEEEEGSM